MIIWGLVRNALGLSTVRYADGNLKKPNLTVEGNIPVVPLVATGTGLVSLVQIPDNTDGQAALGSGPLGVVARLEGWNGATFDRLRSGTTNSDGEVPDVGSLRTGSRGYSFNGGTWDRNRGAIEGTALASAVRNGGPFASADIINYNGRTFAGVIDITAVPGAVTVTATLQMKDPASGKYINIPGTTTAALGAISTTMFQNSSGFLVSTLPRTIRILVTHSAAGNFTYSVGYSIS